MWYESSRNSVDSFPKKSQTKKRKDLTESTVPLHDKTQFISFVITTFKTHIKHIYNVHLDFNHEINALYLEQVPLYKSQLVSLTFIVHSPRKIHKISMIAPNNNTHYINRRRFVLFCNVMYYVSIPEDRYWNLPRISFAVRARNNTAAKLLENRMNFIPFLALPFLPFQSACFGKGMEENKIIIVFALRSIFSLLYMLLSIWIILLVCCVHWTVKDDSTLPWFWKGFFEVLFGKWLFYTTV